jgi:hypothetical protein
MSTFTSEPGTRLGGRYRLEDRVAAGAGWAAWKAIDETLARAVTVLTFAPGFPRIREVVTAARAASRMSDARLAQVFDVEDDWDHAYIVMEWAAGDSLDDLLTGGPLDPERAAQIIAEAADALSVAHAAGLAHLCLTPNSLRWTPGGGVKIVGLGIDAALAGSSAEDPALADTRGLGRLLYASLTGHWPGPDCATLPPAPISDGLVCTPRQVRAGVPAALDEITCQALMLRTRRESALTTPAQLAAALTDATPPAPLPPSPPSPPALVGPDRGREDGDRYWSADERAASYWKASGQPAPQRARSQRPAKSGRWGVIAVVVLIIVVGGVVAAAHRLEGNSTGSHARSGHKSVTAHPGNTVLKPLSAHGFDAYNLSDTSDENTQFAENAIDGNPTGWFTQFYFSPLFGDLKPGTGLMLDMGKQVRLSSVTIKFGQIPGADVEIKIGNSSVRAPATVTGMTTVAQADDVGGTHTFTVHSSASGRYILIWFTRLPPMANNSNRFQAQIFNIVVRGTAG